MREIPKVALLVETARGFGRDLLLGIARYSRLHGPWSFHITPGDYEQAVPKMKQWGGTGIIARIPNDRVAKAIIDADVPDDRPRADRRTNAARQSAREVLGDQLRRHRSLAAGRRALAGAAVHATSPMSAATTAAGRRGAKRRSKRIYRQRGFEPYVYRQPKRPRDRIWEREQDVLGRAGSASCRRRSACSPATTTAAARCWKPAAWRACTCRRTSRSSASTTTRCSASCPTRRYRASR